jgi:DNA-binding response OmpR family regulator
LQKQEIKADKVTTEGQDLRNPPSTTHMTRRILIVDDEPDIGFTFKLALEENGFKERIDVYNDPSLAADLYDLLLLDIAMPRDIGGFTFYEKIRKIDSKIRVFVMKAFGVNYEVLAGRYRTKDYENVLATILENGGGRFIRKPIDVFDLVKRVKAEL